jgi:hypothetical protein
MNLVHPPSKSDSQGRITISSADDDETTMSSPSGFGGAFDSALIPNLQIWQDVDQPRVLNSSLPMTSARRGRESAQARSLQRPYPVQDNSPFAGLEEGSIFYAGNNNNSSSSSGGSRSQAGTLNRFPSSKLSSDLRITSSPLDAGFRSEVWAVEAWFGCLGGAERAAAFSAVAQLAAPHETQHLCHRQPPDARRGAARPKDLIPPHLVPIGTPPRGHWRNSDGTAASPGMLGACPGPDSFIRCPSGETHWLCSWLRGLRLHKYAQCLKNLTMDELLALDDDALQKKGVNTFGARKKLTIVRSFLYIQSLDLSSHKKLMVYRPLKHFGLRETPRVRPHSRFHNRRIQRRIRTTLHRVSETMNALRRRAYRILSLRAVLTTTPTSYPLRAGSGPHQPFHDTLVIQIAYEYSSICSQTCPNARVFVRTNCKRVPRKSRE